MPTSPALHILNASAGSGKTYHLVKEYIRILISEDDNPTTFSGIIAMTFTNKAALEMKERIIEALDQISRQSGEKDDLAATLAGELNISTEEVNKRCTTVLEAILHRYEDFNVMTIDKFNLRLIKSFARDLDLPNDFEVVLDESEIIEKIVDDLLNQLGESGDKTLNKLLIRYAKANIDEGNSWNFRRSLIEFGGILKSERNSAGIRRLLEMDLSIETYQQLHIIRTSVEKKYHELGLRLMEELEATDTSALPGGGHTVNDIKSIASKSSFPVDTALIKKRLEGNMEKENPKKVFPESLKRALIELNTYWESAVQEYAAIQLFLSNFFNMALLQYMAKALEATKREEQIIRISEFNTLISALIQEEHAPFIYERLGTRYKHFLLDEFQDTSHLQWLNLVPLIHESIGQNNRNLIVGDPKQSIYRFKNGVAEQFVALPEIYNPDENQNIRLKSQFFKQMGSVSELNQNWRSSPQIVNFNNHFFETFREKMPESAIDFYNSIKQDPQGKVNGKIRIHSKEEKIAVEDLLPTIIDWIEECKHDGYKPSEICILGGRNKECNAWAVGLNDAGYRVVSADSLLINSNLRVQLSIAYLKWRLRPSGENEKKRFAELFFRIRSESYDDYRRYIKETTTEEGRTYRYFDDTSFLADYFGGYTNFFFKYESIYDLIQGFFSIAEYKELENPYLHHLADIMYEFGLKRGPNLKAFVEEYERKKDSIAVQIPEAEDAIKIMTIHKSKGLEFPVVLIPTFNFSMDIKSKFLVGVDDFMIYKRPAQSEVLRPLITLYEHERDQIITDNINLCYVGMTRPVERLYIRNYFENKRFGQLFHETLKDSGLAAESEGELIVEIDDGERTPPKKKKMEAAIFEPVEISDRLWFPHIAFQDNEELNTEFLLSEEQQFGIQFHYLISKIHSTDAIDKELQEAIDSGEIAKANATQLKERLTGLLTDPDYMRLFDGALKILNEQSIIVNTDTSIRPDKIIIKKDATLLIDYKTGLPKASDEKQVREYRSTLEAMNYPNVECYLFYTALNELRQLA